MKRNPRSEQGGAHADGCGPRPSPYKSVSYLMRRAPPVGGIEADHAGAQLVEGHGRRQEGARKGAIVLVGGCQAKEHGQARGAAEQRMEAVAMQEARAMVGRRVPMLGIGVAAAPGF